MCFFQLQEEILLMEFEVYHNGVEKILGRSVQILEFEKPDLLFAEALKKYSPT